MSHYALPTELPIETARRLWAQLGDVPLLDNSDLIDEPFLHFARGEDRLEIWHWFEETYDVSVARDLMGLK